MKLKKAIIEVMGRDQLKRACDDLGLTDVDRRSREEMAKKVSRAHRADPTTLLAYLNEVDVKAVCELVGESPVGRRGALVERLTAANDEPVSKPVEKTKHISMTQTQPPKPVSPKPISLNPLPAASPRGNRVIAPGAHIEIRDAVWRVVRVDQTSSDRAAWRCIGVSEIVRDQEAVFLEEFEPDVRVLDPRETTLVRDTSSHHRAGLLYIESLLRDVPPPDDRLCIGHRAAMDTLDFQLTPAWQALKRPRQRILIADAVGLGKTLEAGILLSELIRRGRGRRILVATVQSMLTQFQKEMWCRFTIPLVRLDSVGLQRIRGDIPTHHNPFYYFDRAIISIDTLKQNNWFRTHLEQAYWDVIVVDEAHNVATRGSGQSQRAKTADLLASRCDSLILLSATPHDGKARSFASLMNMLDPTAIANPDEYTESDIHGLYTRRFKSDVADELMQRIPERKIATAWSSASDLERIAFESLASLSFSRIDQKAHGGLLFKTTLEKELFSSPAACLSTIQNRVRRLEKQPDAESFKKDITALNALAADVRAIHEDRTSFSKYQKLIELIRDTWAWKAERSKEDRIVIFTERRETLAFLKEYLVRDLRLKDGAWRELHGSMSDKDQQEVVEAFGKTQDPVRLLLATDVASEGLNLHYLSHRLIHFDVPWSLMKFQQRNGRVDRYGQKEQPQIVYLLTEPRHEAIRGDVRILELLIQKDDQANKNIGDPSAFMNVYDIDEEELITARAIESGLSPDRFDETLESQLVDPFAIMLGEAAISVTESAPIGKPASLFGSDFEYLKTATERLRETVGLQSTLNTKEKLAEIRPTDDLLRRLKKLPREVYPDDGVLLFTADPDRMQRALDDARKEENAWPKHHYLWPNSPIFAWAADRLRGEFSRHSAPIIAVKEGFADHETVFLVSGLLPNRRAQPLVHRWYAVSFIKDALQAVEPFDAFLEQTGFGKRDLPNAKEAVDTSGLSVHLQAAVNAVQQQLSEDKQQFLNAVSPRLAEETVRLDELKKRQLDFADLLYGGRSDALAETERNKRRRQVERIFSDHKRWVEDAMTVGSTPFVQVIAVLINLSGREQ